MSGLDEIRERWTRDCLITAGHVTRPLAAKAPADIAHLLTLADALARLVETEPLVEDGEYGIHACAYCQEVADSWPDARPVKHAPECPWQQACRLLAED